MKKGSKHYRKDVIMMRAIVGVACVVILALIISMTKGTSDSDNTDKKKPNNSENKNTEQLYNEQSTDSELEIEIDSEFDNPVEATYVKTTSKVNLRKEPNTTCEIIVELPIDVKAELLEEANGWYKVSYEGQEGYISKEYAKIVNIESESESESESQSSEKTYVKTTSANVRLRREANTTCEVMMILENGVQVELVEELQEWYKVSHQEQVGYIS
ncbi:MAG: SH3 domain-containing protein, partial [Lachnospiraceae bacterium]|nr:SH3 domain-containing protein [Lachnospiraceae bacterium]